MCAKQALALQYQWTLESINDNLPQVSISLVVKQGQLQFDPPLEDLRSAHYKTHLRPVLAIPINFKVSLAVTMYCQQERLPAIAFNSNYLVYAALYTIA